MLTPGGGAIVSVRLVLFVEAGVPESFTMNVSGVAFAAAVGVPVMAPVDALSDRPAGSAPLVSDQA